MLLWGNTFFHNTRSYNSCANEKFVMNSKFVWVESVYLDATNNVFFFSFENLNTWLFFLILKHWDKFYVNDEYTNFQFFVFENLGFNDLEFLSVFDVEKIETFYYTCQRNYRKSSKKYFKFILQFFLLYT